MEWWRGLAGGSGARLLPCTHTLAAGGSQSAIRFVIHDVGVLICRRPSVCLCPFRAGPGQAGPVRLHPDAPPGSGVVLKSSRQEVGEVEIDVDGVGGGGPHDTVDISILSPARPGSHRSPLNKLESRRPLGHGEGLPRRGGS